MRTNSNYFLTKIFGVFLIAFVAWGSLAQAASISKGQCVGIRDVSNSGGQWGIDETTSTKRRSTHKQLFEQTGIANDRVRIRRINANFVVAEWTTDRKCEVTVELSYFITVGDRVSSQKYRISEVIVGVIKNDLAVTNKTLYWPFEVNWRLSPKSLNVTKID